ncbi:MAG: hypothetical protein SGARI_002690 [Bacillariaceae sp.]
MYGTFLLPLAAAKENFIMLEIGLGCDMTYGPGASVQLWKTLFPKATLWEAEFDGTCVQKARERGELDGINTLVGDQGNATVLDQWISESGGNFDVKLWPEVNPGGFYFVEDMHVGNVSQYSEPIDDCDGKPFHEKVFEWGQQLVYPGRTAGYKHKLPEDMLFVHCQPEACVFGKRYGEANGPIPLGYKPESQNATQP